MGIDGFSMSNLGLNRNMTSAQNAHEADFLARQKLENQISDIDGVSKKEKAGKKDEDAAFNGMMAFIKPDNPEENEEEQTDTEQDDSPTEKPLYSNDDDEDEYEEKYHFVYNESGMIEIWEVESNKLLKVISPENAQEVVEQIHCLPSILVNKRV